MGNDETTEVTRDALKLFLLDSGLSRKSLGEKCGVSLATVNGWCSCMPIPVRKQAIIRGLMDAHSRQTESPYVTIKCTPYEAAQMKQAADLLGESLAEFCLRSCRVRATAVLGGRGVKTADSPHEPGKD